MISATGPLGRRPRRDRPTAAPALLAVVLAAALAVLLPAAAQASAGPGKPIALDVPNNGNAPLVVYDADSTTTFVAWSNPQAGGVWVCVLPNDTASCSGSGPVLLNVTKSQNSLITGSNMISLGALVVDSNGDVVVTGQPVDGSTVTWESAASGSAFLLAGQGLQYGGKFISPVSLYRTFGNAAPLGDSDILLLDSYDGGLSDSSVAGPESPAFATANENPDAYPPDDTGLYSGKAYYSSGSEIAAEPDPLAPAGDYVMVGVADNQDGPTAGTFPGCFDSDDTGFGVSVGSVDGSSNAAGTLNGEGLPNYGLLACSAEAPVLAAGTDGIGVLEDEGNAISGAGSTNTIDYRPFTATATSGSFGHAVRVATLSSLGEDTDLVADSGTGLYAMWADEQGIYFDYSPNGGKAWDGPVAAPYLAETNGDQIGQGYPMIAGVGGGELELAYDDDVTGNGTQTYVQEVDVLPTPRITSKQKSGRSSGASISITAGTVGETDKATLKGASPLARGTLTYALYSTKYCSAAKKVLAYVKSVTGSSVPASNKITRVLKKGTYYWKLSYSGDSNDKSSSTKCGAEKLTVKKPKRT